MDNTFSPTPFDSHLQNHTLQLLKTAFPYIPYPRQHMIATVIKLLELSMANSMLDQKEPALQMCEGMNSSGRILQMLEAIRPVCSQADQSNIDMITNVMSLFDIYGDLLNN